MSGICPQPESGPAQVAAFADDLLDIGLRVGRPLREFLLALAGTLDVAGAARVCRLLLIEPGGLFFSASSVARLRKTQFGVQQSN